LLNDNDENTAPLNATTLKINDTVIENPDRKGARASRTPLIETQPLNVRRNAEPVTPPRKNEVTDKQTRSSSIGKSSITISRVTNERRPVESPNRAEEINVLSASRDLAQQPETHLGVSEERKVAHAHEESIKSFTFIYSKTFFVVTLTSIDW
jgi:hypothetical protein